MLVDSIAGKRSYMTIPSLQMLRYNNKQTNKQTNNPYLLATG